MSDESTVGATSDSPDGAASTEAAGAASGSDAPVKQAPSPDDPDHVRASLERHEAAILKLCECVGQPNSQEQAQQIAAGLKS